MKITNIANNRDKGGYFYSSESYHPTTHHLQLEPWIGGQWLRLDEEIEAPDSVYFQEKDLLDALKANRIIDFATPEAPKEELKVEEKKEVKTEKIIPLEDLTDTNTRFAERVNAPPPEEFKKIVSDAFVKEIEPKKKYNFQKGKK